MTCPKCGHSLLDDSKFCAYCGTNLFDQRTEDGKIICPYCGEKTEKGNFCTNCRGEMHHYALQAIKPGDELNSDALALRMQAAQLQMQKRQLELQTSQVKTMARCPVCGCTSLSGDKKGFGVGKAVVGAAIVGPIGLIAGNINADKVKVTCMNCGHKFWAGKRW